MRAWCVCATHSTWQPNLSLNDCQGNPVSNNPYVHTITLDAKQLPTPKLCPAVRRPWVSNHGGGGRA